MPRHEDLSKHMRDISALIREYEHKLLLESDPREQIQLRDAIDDLWAQLRADLAEYGLALPRNRWPSDIVDMAASPRALSGEVSAMLQKLLQGEEVSDREIVFAWLHALIGQGQQAQVEHFFRDLARQGVIVIRDGRIVIGEGKRTEEGKNIVVLEQEVDPSLAGTLADLRQLGLDEPIFDFINREEEKRFLCGQADMPFILVDAPAGYGKTTLLEQVRGHFQERDWLIAALDFREAGVPEDERGMLLALIQAIPLQVREVLRFPKEESLVSLDAGALQLALRNGIARGRRPGLLLVFDSVERVDAGLRLWLREGLIYECYDFCRDRLPQSGFRCIVSGRYITSDWQDTNRTRRQRFLSMSPLTPFSEEIVADALRRAYDEAGVAAPAWSELVRLARTIVSLSGGHPRSITRMLGYIKENPGARVDDFTYNQFSYVLQDIYYEILLDIPGDLQQIFPLLSILRWGNANLLEEFGKQVGVIPDSFPTGVALLGRLMEVRLWTFDSAVSGYRDDICRRVMAAHLYYNDEDRHRDLHDSALQICEGWLQAAPEDAFYAPIMVVEGLYHFLNLLGPRTGPEIERKLQDLLDYLWGNMIADAARKVKAVIMGDEELQELLYNHTGQGNYVSQVIEVLVDAFIRDHS